MDSETSLVWGMIFIAHILVAVAFSTARHIGSNKRLKGLNMLAILAFIGLFGFVIMGADTGSEEFSPEGFGLLALIFGVIRGVRSLHNPDIDLSSTVFWYIKLFRRNKPKATQHNTTHRTEQRVIHEHRVIVEHRVVNVKNDGTREVFVVFQNGDRQVVDVPREIKQLDSYIKQLPRG